MSTPSRNDAPPRAGTPISVIGIDHIVLRCVDLERTLVFYRDVLGCPLEREVADIGLYQLRAGNALIDLVPVGSALGGVTPPHKAAFNVAHFCLVIGERDWEAVRSHLRAHGVVSSQPAVRYGAGGFDDSIYLCDPEGNEVELRRAAQSTKTTVDRPGHN